MSPAATALRAQLLDAADQGRAADLASALANEVNLLLNAARVPVGTSLLVRALAARAVLVVAADWWGERGQPVPETWAALRSLIDDLPVTLDGYSFRVDQDKGKAA